MRTMEHEYPETVLMNSTGGPPGYGSLMSFKLVCNPKSATNADTSSLDRWMS